MVKTMLVIAVSLLVGFIGGGYVVKSQYSQESPYIVKVPLGWEHTEKQYEPPWCVKIPTKDHLGEKVDIVVFPHALQRGGFVVNVHSPRDRNGKCWGTVIYK